MRRDSGSRAQHQDAEERLGPEGGRAAPEEGHRPTSGSTTHKSGGAKHTPQWQPIETAPVMYAILLFHEYYSHGQVRHGYMNRKGQWTGVNAIGTENAIRFDPTHWMPLPSPPEQGSSS